MNFLIGNVCNLHCHNCAHFVPFHRKHAFYSIEDFSGDAEQFFHTIDNVNYISFASGEAFLDPDFGKKLGVLSKYAKQYDEIDIVSNGTKMPDEVCLNAMASNNKVQVVFSDYSSVIAGNEQQLERIESKLAEHGISYRRAAYLGGKLEENRVWSDMGDIRELKERPDKETATIFQGCSNRMCKLIYQGRLFTCAIAGLIEYGELRNAADTDWCKLSDGKEKILETYYGLNYHHFPDICRYCDGMGNAVNSKTVEAAIQL